MAGNFPTSSVLSCLPKYVIVKLKKKGKQLTWEVKAINVDNEAYNRAD